MATLTDYQVYHNYVVGSVSTFTAIAKSVFIAGELDDNGVPVTTIQLSHIENYANTATKDSLLYDLLRQMERFEQTSANLTGLADLDPIREMDPGSGITATPTATPTPTPTPTPAP